MRKYNSLFDEKRIKPRYISFKTLSPSSKDTMWYDGVINLNIESINWRYETRDFVS